MNNKFIIVKNPDGKVYYCKNIDKKYNDNNYFMQNIYYLNKINLHSGLIKIIIFIDILGNYDVYNLYNLYNLYNFNTKYLLYFDLFIDLIALYSVSIFNKNLFLIYILKYYFITIISIYSIILCNKIIYNNYIINSNTNTTIHKIYFLDNYECIYLNIVTIVNITILIILQNFHNNIDFYKNVINNVINLY